MELCSREGIAHIRSQIEVTRNPLSKDRLRKVLAILLDAQAAWLEPGQQARAQRLEQQARDLLSNEGKPWPKP
jgi:hypothetical protein